VRHRPNPHTRWLPGLAFSLLVSGACAQAADDDATLNHRAASCVAVLEHDAQALARRYQAGDKAVRPGLVRLTEQGFTFIGKAYLRGLRKAEADRLVAEAVALHKTLSADALQQLSSGCQAEGAKLFTESNMLERALVSNRAKARVETLLAPKKPR
jgi:hypothetical protein